MQLWMKFSPYTGCKIGVRCRHLLQCISCQHHSTQHNAQLYSLITLCRVQSYACASISPKRIPQACIPSIEKHHSFHTHMNQNSLPPHHSIITRRSRTQTAAENDEVTFENLFSDTNRQRVIDHLDTVKPARSSEMMGVKTAGKTSAVLVPLCMVDGEPSVLFTLRSSSLRSHRGEVSFPGGIQDETDQHHVHTALRETFEEIGLNPRYFDVWGTMIPTPSSKKGGYMAYPVLARYTKNLDLNRLTINRDEVEDVFTCSVRELCEGGKVRVGSTQFRSGPGYTLPVYLGTPHRIWGLTAIILHQVLTLLAPGLYTYTIRHVA
ncbi:mitochondrial coenzyme A diphosphatase NUDT8-like [Babylonia areolata]|uniref:mitochondrial coenzyme A diphosphatase NUDT8-like n=1 Tax=Babylonia areolata TaxID=304850 RepID=UPI003FD06273